jgi:hypothetical protein
MSYQELDNEEIYILLTRQAMSAHSLV